MYFSLHCVKMCSPLLCGLSKGKESLHFCQIRCSTLPRIVGHLWKYSFCWSSISPTFSFIHQIHSGDCCMSVGGGKNISSSSFISHIILCTTIMSSAACFFSLKTTTHAVLFPQERVVPVRSFIVPGAFSSILSQF